MSVGKIQNPGMVIEPMKPIQNGRLQHLFSSQTKPITNTVTLITPTMAARWLEGNVKNRKPSAALVDRYAAAIKAGNWMLTHQGIAFTSDQTLVDGQHRLMAIVQADQPVEMYVAHGVEADAIMAIDQNRVRRAHEQFTLKGGLGTINHKHIGILRAMIAGLGPSFRANGMAEEFELMKQHHEAVMFASDTMKNHRRGICVAPVLAVFGRAFYCADHDKIRAFADALGSGVTNLPNAITISTLASWLLDRPKGLGGSADRTEIYGKTSRALYGWLKGEKLTKLYIPTQELFILPETQPLA